MDSNYLFHYYLNGEYGFKWMDTEADLRELIAEVQNDEAVKDGRREFEVIDAIRIIACEHLDI